MEGQLGDILRFLAFGVIWIFPVLIIVAIFGSTRWREPPTEQPETPADNVIPFPRRDRAEPRRREKVSGVPRG